MTVDNKVARGPSTGTVVEGILQRIKTVDWLICAVLVSIGVVLFLIILVCLLEIV
jgi:hypothetical protein